MADKDVDKLVLNLTTPKITQDTLDNEVRSMFKNRREGLDYINANYPEGHKDRATVMSRLDAVYPRRVKGSSPEYTQRINSQYESVLPLLKEKGYDVDSITSDNLYEQFQQLFNKHDEELKQINENLAKHRMPANTGDELWKSKYKEIYNALNILGDKLYNDYWQANAPMGYEED